MRRVASTYTDEQRRALGLPVTDAERRASNAAVFGRLSRAAAKSNRPDADRLAAHYEARARRET